MKGTLGIIAIGTLALLAISGVAAGYFLLADVWPVTANINGLTSFGTFFGGVASPILGLFTLFGVIFTLALQGAQLRQLQDAHIADQHIRALNTLLDDLQALEQQPYAPEQTLGYALVHPNEHIGDEKLSPLVRQYLEVLGLYASQVDMYRENISPYWDCQAFALRGKRLLSRIRPLAEHLNSWNLVTLGIIEGHLSGSRS
ncbi:hypothetical protein [Stutzerimonas nitrititolerans]|uniref:hypothetical protein n=1 Tax=Stutzerimonas nitrititolerans TaxID=2482751 RepID=UPI00289D892F|nr:hypothetical protein [Stutzerimonas nitrititolerans]